MKNTKNSIFKSINELRPYLQFILLSVVGIYFLSYRLSTLILIASHPHLFASKNKDNNTTRSYSTYACIASLLLVYIFPSSTALRWIFFAMTSASAYIHCFLEHKEDFSNSYIQKIDVLTLSYLAITAAFENLLPIPFYTLVLFSLNIALLISTSLAFAFNVLGPIIGELVRQEPTKAYATTGNNPILPKNDAQASNVTQSNLFSTAAFAMNAINFFRPNAFLNQEKTEENRKTSNTP